MNESPSLSEIAAEHNLLATYIRYVDRCIDEKNLPIRYSEWLWEVASLNDLYL